jgi:hypothetical protein
MKCGAEWSEIPVLAPISLTGDRRGATVTVDGITISSLAQGEVKFQRPEIFSTTNPRTLRKAQHSLGFRAASAAKPSKLGLILPTHPTALKARRSPRFPRCIYRAGCVHIIHPAIPARDIAVANNSESGNNGGAQAAFPLMGGQSSGKGRRASLLSAKGAAFREGLQKLGWTEGGNIRIDYRWAASGDAGSMQLSAKELIALQPDLLLSQNTPTTAALLQQTRTIRVIFAVVSDPVGSGFVASFPRPGGKPHVRLTRRLQELVPARAKMI